MVAGAGRGRGGALLITLGVVLSGCGDRSDVTAPVADQTELVWPEDFEVPPAARERPPGLLPVFRAIGAESGFDFERFDDISPLRRILEVNGGGVAVQDFDRDGRLDVFMTNGCRLPLDPADRETPSALFRNRGGMQFQRVTNSARIAQFGYASGCAAGDIDSDGFMDLYVAAFGRNNLWRNNGDGTFEDITNETGADVPVWSSSAAFADVNGDGHPDLYVVNYLDESDVSPHLCPNAASPDGYEGCSPAVFNSVDDVLLISDGAGHLRDVTDESGIADHHGKGLGVVIADLDRNGRPEIYVANDGQANFLFTRSLEGSDSPASSGTIRYDECALSHGVALNESGYAQAGMGVAAGDYDANGTTDLFLTHFYGDTNTLYVNHGDLLFEDGTRGCGAGPTSRRRLGFGTVFFDVDNDGWLDLMVVNGHVDDRTWKPTNEPYHMRPELYHNEGGFLRDVSDWGGEYFQSEWLGRGLAVGDLDRDGRVDAVVSHQLAPSVVLRNESPTESQSVTLQFTGAASTRDGTGVRVEVIDSDPRIVRELYGGGSFQSASAHEIHLGMNGKPALNLRVVWPSGRVDTHHELTPGTCRLLEGGRKVRLGELR